MIGDRGDRGIGRDLGPALEPDPRQARADRDPAGQGRDLDHPEVPLATRQGRWGDRLALSAWLVRC